MSNTPTYADRSYEQERKVLGFEALSSLADQFAHNPDLQTLIDSVALSVAGQFAVTSAVILTRNNNLDTRKVTHSAIGKFRGWSVSIGHLRAALRFAEAMAAPRPIDLSELNPDDGDAEILMEWKTLGVRLFVPLVVNDSAIGAILMGPCVGDRECSDENLQLLQHFVASITPLLATTVIYAEMAALSARHIQILDSVRQAMLVFDSGGTLVSANRAANDLTASTRGRAGDSLEIGGSIETVFPDDVYAGWAERLRKLQTDQSARLPAAMIAKGADGERVFSVSVRLGVELSASEKGMIITLDDKTEEISNERRMFELEKFAERGVMASSISHELNNHLGMILGGVELAMIALDRGNQPKLKETLVKLRDSVTRMERFTAGLMDYARINPQKLPALMNDIVTDVISFAAIQKRFSAIKLNANLTPQLPELQVDRDQIAQVIINIINNAADAILETGRRDGIIIVSTCLDKGELVLRVSDNGRGMTPEVREKLFKIHLTTKPQGHGYGLTTCARILENHGAGVSIESRIGFGTTFEFRFPLS